ncbi:hypothetical protein Q1695_015086 [Nippostrongylus brasiliensis]|nr:hypothetical protein Q1695_015086 [Nippostrongylus brasiliensis]
MQRSHAPYASPSPKDHHGCNGCELNLEKILTQLSFIRINIDSIDLPEENPFIAGLFEEGSLYGFNLEYQFPCLENVSRSLKAPVRIPAKSFTMTNVQFRHRRVVLVQLTSDIIPYWKKHHLIVRLHVQLNTRGKFSTRFLGHCVVPLSELLVPPFMICRDFHLIPTKGMTVEGSCLIRIDLGTRDKILKEKLDEMRNPLLESTYTISGVNGHQDQRYPSRKNTHEVNYPPVNENRPPSARFLGSAVFRERASSNVSDVSDSVFEDYRYPHGSNRQIGNNPDQRRTVVTEAREFFPAVRPGSSSSIREKERESSSRLSVIQLTVHEGHGLPPVRDERNRFVSPNAYVSVLGRDGELRSSICEQSRRPLWNWTARFCISGERRNIIVKVFHHDVAGDRSLGFVSIPLPIEEAHRVDYEIVDLTGATNISGEVPVLTMSMEASEVRRPSSSSRLRSSTSSWAESMGNSSRASPSLPSMSAKSSRAADDGQIITATREELAEKLRRNMDDLDQLISKIKR